MVVTAFHGEKPFEKAECRHLNGNKQDNRSVNLKWGTRLENMADRKRLWETAHGVNAPTAKLNDEKVIKIRELYATGKYTYKKLSEMYDVHSRSIGDIVSGEHWKHVAGPIITVDKRILRNKKSTIMDYVEENRGKYQP